MLRIPTDRRFQDVMNRLRCCGYTVPPFWQAEPHDFRLGRTLDMVEMLDRLGAPVRGF